jgi:uncharacterized membrane protein YecN with MAPEG domain
MDDLHISLLSVALAAIILQWLGWRCGKLRMSENILHGDGGHGLLARRMRAMANFTEYTPIALLLVLVLDLARQDGWALALLSLAFLLGRVLHAIGMDAETAARPRMVGMLLTMPVLVILSVWAVLAGLRVV